MIKLQLNPDARMLRQFAWIGLVAFPLIAWTFHLPTPWFYVVAGLGPLTLVTHLVGIAAIPRTVFRAAVLLTFPIGLVVFPVILGLIYYGVMTPIGLCLRLCGHDAMGRKTAGARTWWHERGPARPANSYFKLY